jgi:vacuolar-type H+-ATPase subunit H
VVGRPRQALIDDARTESRSVISDVAKRLETLEHESLPERTR